MLPPKAPRQRDRIERPPSKVVGLIYLVVGFFAMCFAAFVLLVQGYLGPITNFRIGFGAVIALYGLFRIYTGISTIRKANQYKSKITIAGSSAAAPKPPLS